MDLYHSCINVIHEKTASSAINEEGAEALTEISEDLFLPQSTYPAVLSQGTKRTDEHLPVYYISDLHLDNHIVAAFPNGAIDKDVIEYIGNTVLKLLEGDIVYEIRHSKSPVILFGGDIASSFEIAALFYRTFKTTWRILEKKAFDASRRERASLKKELDACERQIEIWKKKHPWAYRAVKSLTEYNSVPTAIKEIYNRSEDIKQQLWKLESELDTYRRERYRANIGCKYVYAVLGNHEFWGFETYSACAKNYSALFSELGITFLNSDIAWLGKHRIPMRSVIDPKTGKYHYEPLSREDDPKSYDIQDLFSGNVIIVGGVGFAPQNAEFNANQMIYGSAIDPEEERMLANKWIDTYYEGKELAKEHHCSLVVLSHTPFSDWMNSDDDLTNTVFFSGHTHRNTSIHDRNNVHYYADNQVGYSKNRFTFKRVDIYKPRNPFAADPDGIREITVSEFTEFYRYMNEDVPGTGHINNHIRDYSGKLLMIKREGYYGFFVSSPKGIYICNGGQINKIDSAGDFEAYYPLFMIMVQTYIIALSPYRKIQEQVASAVKNFGGTGKIHGCIVDVDFWNHIMMNPVDGTITYYYSPSFGKVKTYSTMQELLANHCPALLDRFENVEIEKPVPSVGWAVTPSSDAFEIVDIRYSPYAISRKVNPIQRLFDKRILRAWDTEVLLKAISKLKALAEPEVL